MAVNFRQEKKKQKYLIGVIFVVVLITLAVLYFGVFEKEKPAVISMQPTDLVQEVKVDFSVLEHPFFDQIKPFQKIPDFEGGIGRINPFLPY